MMEPSAAWGKQERERAHAVSSDWHLTSGPQVKQPVTQLEYTHGDKRYSKKLDPGRRSGTPGLPLPPLLRLRLQLARRLLTKWRRPWKRQPHFVPGRACQQNADLAKAEEQKAAARSRYRERREESEGFHRPPAAERRLSINACLMNKPAIRLMLQVTLSSTKKCLGILLALISTETKRLAYCSISEIPEGSSARGEQRGSCRALAGATSRECREVRWAQYKKSGLTV
ncbi:uncharacterized protein FYN16_006972 [Cariama cristata]